MDRMKSYRRDQVKLQLKVITEAVQIYSVILIPRPCTNMSQKVVPYQENLDRSWKGAHWNMSRKTLSKH